MPILLVLVSLFLFTEFTPTQAAEKEIPRFLEVNDDFYRGGRPESERDIDILKSRGIRTVISLENRPEEVARERRWVEAENMNFYNFELSVYESPTDQEVDRILHIINDPSKQPVFIHCKHGKDRTGLIVGVYRVEHEDMRPENAYREMLRYGFDPRWRALVRYFEARTEEN